MRSRKRWRASSASRLPRLRRARAARRRRRERRGPRGETSATTAPSSPSRSRSRSALAAGAARARVYARLVFGTAGKLHVPLESPRRPPPCRASRRPSGRGPRAAWREARRRSRPRSPAARARDRSARRRASAGEPGSRPCGRSGPSSRRSARPCSRDWGAEHYSGGSYACHPPGWSRARRRGAGRSARPRAPRGRAHGRPSSAGRWKAHCAAVLARPPRCSPRARRRIDLCPICDLHWWLADGSRESSIDGASTRARGRTGQRNRKPAPRSCGGAVQARHHPRQRRRAGPARRLSPCPRTAASSGRARAAPAGP